MDAAGFDRAVLVGCSQGGRIAIDAALAKPGRVLGLALVAPAVTGAPTPEAYPPPVQALVDAYETADAAGDAERLNELEARVWLDGVLGEPLRVRGELRALFLDMNRMALDAAGPGPERPAPPAWPRVHELGLPALVVWGPLDFPHLNDRCRLLVATLPQARALVVDGTAHLPSMEKPEVFNIALAEFIGTLGSARNAGGK
jgi:pimeloyl-ACP methyl ester carboxylesterase